MMYETKPFYCNCFIFIIIFLAHILLCIAQQNTIQSSTIPEKAMADLVATKTTAKDIDLSTELDSNLNIYKSPAPVQHSPEQLQPLVKASPVVCYVCNSHKDPECLTQPEKFKTNCTNVNKGSEYAGCRKIDQWVDYDGGEDLKKHHRVIRQCASDGDITKPCYYRAGFGGRVNVCYCDKDLCNSAFTLKTNNFYMTLLIISTIFLLLHRNRL